MAISPHVIYWIGVIIAYGIYLYVACRTIDSIWDMELTGIIHDVVWGLVLRNVIRWLLGIYILVGTGTILIAVVLTYKKPWESLAWVLGGIPILRILVWFFWRLAEDADTMKWGRDSRAEQQGIHGWDRFSLWCFSWGPYEGLLTKEEKERYRAAP